MPSTKPIGPHCLHVMTESTPFAFEAYTANTAIRHFESSFGDSVQNLVEQEAVCHRGTYFETRDRFNDVEFSITIPFFGSGAAGTAIAPRKSLWEAGAGLSEVVSGGTSVTYETDVSNPAESISLYRVDRESVLGEYLYGAIIQNITITLNKADAPQIEFSGIASRKWEFYKTTLAAPLDAVAGTTSMTITDGKRLRTGSSEDVQTGLEIYVQIESEVIKITGITHSTGVCVIEREQFSTTAAAHASSTDVSPHKIAPTFAEVDQPLGAHDWTVSDGADLNVRSFDIAIATGRMFDELQTGSAASSAIHNSKIETTGSLTFILDNERAELFRDMDAGTDKDFAITLGTVAGKIFTINLDVARLIDPVPKDIPKNAVAEVSQSFRCLDTATALGGQFQIVET